MTITSFSQHYSSEKKKVEDLVIKNAKDTINCIECIPKHKLSKPLTDKLELNKSIILKYEN